MYFLGIFMRKTLKIILFINNPSLLVPLLYSLENHGLGNYLVLQFQQKHSFFILRR